MNNLTTRELLESIRTDLINVSSCPKLNNKEKLLMTRASYYIQLSIFALKELERENNGKNKNNSNK